MNKVYLNTYEDKNDPHNNKLKSTNMFLQMPTLCYA